MSDSKPHKNSKAFKKLVRAWMAANPGWSYQAAMQHLLALKAKATPEQG